MPTVTLCQVIDDSTKTVFGPNTVGTLRERDLLSGNYALNRIDTSLTDFHNTDEFLLINGRPQKNAGYISAPQAPMHITQGLYVGRQLGLSAFDYLYYDPDSLPFYQSYSLYSRVHYIQGGQGRQWIEFEGAKNLSSTFNTFLRFRRLTSERQLNVTRGNQRATIHTAYAAGYSGIFFNGKFLTTGVFSNMRQDSYETGGVRVDASDGRQGKPPYDSLLLYDLSPSVYAIGTTFGSSYLPTEVIEQRRALRLNQVFKFNRDGQIYLTANHYQYSYRFTNLYRFNGILAQPYYDNFFFTADTTRNRIQYRDQYLALGASYNLKGHFIDVSARYRRVRYATLGLAAPDQNETWLSVYLRNRDSSRFGYNIQGTLLLTGDFKLSGTFAAKGAYASASLLRQSPTAVSQQMFSNHFLWDNALQKLNILDLKVGYAFAGRRLGAYAQAHYQVIDNYIYYSDSSKPQQFSGGLTLLYPEVGATLRVGKLTFYNQVIASQTNHKEFVRVPALYWRSVPYLTFRLANGKYQLEPGIELRYRSNYAGDLYEPSLNVFHLQQEGSGTYTGYHRSLEQPAYFWTAAFINIRINRTRGFFKLGNLTQGLGGANGFFDVPFYPGQHRYFEFGVDWLFFD